MTRILIALILLLPLLAAASGEPLSYEQALRMALEKDFGIRLAREGAEAARIQGGYAKSGFLPRVDLSAGWQRNAGQEEGNSSGSLGDTDREILSAGISLSWTLFDGFGMFVESGRYRELAELGEIQARALVEARVLALNSAYYGLVQQEMLLDLARENDRLSADRLERERRKRDLGALSSSEFLGAEAAYNADRSNTLRQEIARAEASRGLALMIGFSPRDDLEVEDRIDLPPLGEDGETLLEAARARNAGMAGAGLDLRLAERDLAAAKADFWPSLTLTAGYQWMDMSSGGDLMLADIETESRDLSLGLSLNYNLFNGDRRRLARQTASVGLRQAEIALDEEWSILQADLENALRAWEGRRRLAELEAENVASSRQRFSLEEGRYRNGSVGFLEYRDAQLSLFRARSAEISARYQARIARLEIDRLTGRLLPE